jgi:acetate kinase
MTTARLNAGSSSLKFCISAGRRPKPGGSSARPDRGDRHRAGLSRPTYGASSSSAGRRRRVRTAGRARRLAAWIGSATRSRVLGVGHRVVHGGARQRADVVTPQVLTHLRELIPLAPLHSRTTRGDRGGSRALPGVPQVACFDTAFHRGQPPVAELVRSARASAAGGDPAVRLPRALVRVHRLGASRSRPEVAEAPRDRRAPRQRREPVRDAGTARASTARSGSPRSTAVHGHESGRLDPGVVLYLFRASASRTRRSRRSCTRSRGCSASPA